MSKNPIPTEHAHKLYAKLNIAQTDLGFARDHARFVLQEKLHQPQVKGEEARYSLQVALVTALVVTYVRAITESDGLTRLPDRLRTYTDEEEALHKEFMELRNSLYAHSSGEHFHSFARGPAMNIKTVPFYCIKRDKIELFLVMTEKLVNQIDARLVEPFSRIVQTS